MGDHCKLSLSFSPLALASPFACCSHMTSSNSSKWRACLQASKTGLLIFRGKKSKISRDLQGQIRGKIGRFRGIFAGKKSKFAEKSADFAGEELKFTEKSANFAGF